MSEDPKPPTSKRQEHTDRHEEALSVQKLANEIMAAVREGGSSVEHNLRLRSIIQRCRDNNIPPHNINEAIMKLKELSTAMAVARIGQADIDTIAFSIALWLRGPF
jgi:transcriptional/translational regulatory protein YebC/TACO1